MQIVVLNGALSDAEQDRYIRLVTQKVPAYAIEKLYLDVQGDAVYYYSGNKIIAKGLPEREREW